LEPFLKKTANYLAEKYADHLSELCIVLPNRRAGIFFKRHLAQSSGKTLWSPDVFSSEDFIAHISGLEILDPLHQLFELYNVYRKGKREDELESFDEFSKWAVTLLADFNEVDRYMVQAGKLFTNLGDIREIENWSLGNEQLTEFQVKYIQFWDSLGTYYRSFSRSLIDNKKAYPGLAYRYVADNIEELVKQQPWHKIIFAGFNALTAAEERMIHWLAGAGKAEVLWDADKYYTSNRNYEAGRFIRKYKTSFADVMPLEDGAVKWEENMLASAPKSIEVIGVARNVAQAKVAGDIISNLKLSEEDLEDTAIVLADEGLLFPLLHSLPEGVKNVNVTMGFPLRNSPVAGLFDLLFNLHENPLRFGKSNDRFYHRDLVKLLSHPYIHHLYDSAQPVNRYLVQRIQERNAVFISIERLEKELHTEEHKKEFEKIRPLFVKWKHVGDSLKCCYHLIDELKLSLAGREEKNKTESERKANVELEFVFAYAKIIKRIRSLADDYGHITQVRTLRSVIAQAVNTTSLPFYGEPLRGLQVMGMLETRALDFRNIILLSANENILPSGRSQSSFIPHDLKRVFGLPTHTDRDAVFAYHFYRLLQRSSNAFLLYNTETDRLGSGERSRFLTQLIHELPLVNKQAVIKERLLDISAQAVPEPAIIIEKTPEILEKIKEKGEKGFAPTLLNTYKYCPLQFYFQLVAELRELDEVEETIKADTLGTVIHGVLEELYKPFIGKILQAEDVRGMKKQVDGLTEGIFGKSYSSSDLKFGKNLLIMRVALKFIHNLLDREAIFVEEAIKAGKELKIEVLEEDLKSTVTIETEQGTAEVKLRGKADRIDKLGHITRIIDYKTGVVENRELLVKDWSFINTDPDLAKSFQLLMYAYMYHNAHPEISNNLQSGIITFRQLSAGIKPVTVTGTDVLTENILHEFEHQLKDLLKEIYDPSLPFTQTASLEYCDYCSYKSICNR
jgi:ATP-dependent helicase/nuclease subunit B